MAFQRVIKARIDLATAYGLEYWQTLAKYLSLLPKLQAGTDEPPIHAAECLAFRLSALDKALVASCQEQGIDAEWVRQTAQVVDGLPMLKLEPDAALVGEMKAKLLKVVGLS